MSYLGDFKEDGDLYYKFTTRAFATGIPTQLAGVPVLSCWIDEADGTEKTTAEAYFDLDVDFDTVTGLNNVRIDLSGDAFFATGADYAVAITTGTVGGVSVVGETLFTFSIENRSMGQPAGATLAADIAAVKTEVDKIGTIPALDGGAQTVGAAIAKLADDNGGATYNAGEDSLNKIRDDRTLAAADYVVEGDTIAGVTAVVDVTGDVKGNVDGTVSGVTPEAAGVAPTAQEIWDLASVVTLDFGTLLERTYQLLSNEMNVTDATGVSALRNIADDADIASGSITDAAGTTSRAGWSWV